VCVGGKGGQRGGERGKTEKNTYTNYLYAVVNLTQLMIGNEESLYLCKGGNLFSLIFILMNDLGSFSGC
jgi:hypothetical protein